MRKHMLSALAASGLMFGILGCGLPGPAGAADGDIYQQLERFSDAMNEIRGKYVEEIDDEQLMEAAINGMLQSLDPHSSFMSRKQFKQMRVETKGEFGGLGIEVTMENGFVKVVSPIDDTPAAEAGLQAGDLITHLDEEQVVGLTLGEAVDLMRGPVGSDIKLTVARQGESKPFDVLITRAVIKVQSVRSRREGDVAYVRITSFTEQTKAGLERSVARLKREIGKDIKGVVLDLRNNPGGLLDQAIAVSDAFLDRGEIVSTRSRDPKDVERRNARKGDIASGLPVIVLINGGSASASEIVAGALQDHRRAIIMGTQSFGKGSVQTIIPLSGGSALRLTTARYYTPSGKSIQAKGIAPDIEVPQAKLEVLNSSRRRSEADLRNRLDNDTGDRKKGGDNNNKADGTSAKPERSDYQLTRALDLVRAIYLTRNSQK